MSGNSDGTAMETRTDDGGGVTLKAKRIKSDKPDIRVRLEKYNL